MNKISELIFYPSMDRLHYIIFNITLNNMEKIVLKGQKREGAECVKTLRAARVIPAVVYGHKQEAISIKLGNSDLLRTYRVAWENHVVELEIDGKKMDVLFHDIQRAPVSWDFLHIDFYAITKGEKVHTHIPLNFVWVSKAKTEENAVIEELVKQIEVKCLPNDLVDSFEVDLSQLEKTGDHIKVSDLKISSKFEVLDSQDEVIVLAAKTKVEKVEDTAPEANLPVDPKVAKAV